MAKNPYLMLKYFLHNQFFLFRGNSTRNTIVCSMVYHVKKPDFFIMGPFFKIHGHCLIKSFRRENTNNLSWFSSFIFNANPTLSSKSFISDFNSSSFISQFCSKLNSLYFEDEKTVYGVLKQLYIFLYWINFVHHCKEIEHLT